MSEEVRAARLVYELAGGIADTVCQAESVVPQRHARENARQPSLAGVLGAAVIVTLLLTPAMGRVGRMDDLWLDAAITIVPTAVLTATGYRYYGPLRSLGVAVVVIMLTSVITWVVAVFTLAAAVAESPTALVVGIVLYATPAACVVVFALLANRIVSTHPEAAPVCDREQAHR